MIRSQAVVTGSGTTTATANGGLPPCTSPGPSPLPCEVYIDGRANGNPLDLFTSMLLPTPDQKELFYTGPRTKFTRILNRNSPMPFVRPIITITQPAAPAPPPRFPWRAHDLDGLPFTRHYPALSTRDGSGNKNILCSNGNTLTTYGCNGQVQIKLALAFPQCCPPSKH